MSKVVSEVVELVLVSKVVELVLVSKVVEAERLTGLLGCRLSQ